MTIDKINKHEKGLEVICCGGDIEMYVPVNGDNIDVIRTKIKINVGKKYTSNDIHVLQQKLFTELGVSTEHKEIEQN